MRELTDQERVALVSLTMHPGFPILQQIIEDYCTLSTGEVLKCDPTDTARVSAVLSEARAKNAFAAALIKKVNSECQAASTQS